MRYCGQATLPNQHQIISVGAVGDVNGKIQLGNPAKGCYIALGRISCQIPFVKIKREVCVVHGEAGLS